MFNCDQSIIANSSISWRAIWLNNELNKIFVLQKKWILSNEKAVHLIPDNWIIL